MKTKILILLLAGALLLTSCDTLSDLGIGGEKIEEGLGLQEIGAKPTQATVSKNRFFRDDMDADLDAEWGLRVVSGLEDQLVWDQNNGRLRLQTLPPNDLNILFLNRKNTYEDVIVQAEVENLGLSENAFSLVCRANESGWYEFRISSSGYFELLRFDQYKQDEGKNAYTNLIEKHIGSSLIKPGQEKNSFALLCVGTQISALINGKEPYWKKRPLAVEDSTYTKGTIGFGILGYGKELDMVYDWVEVVKP